MARGGRALELGIGTGRIAIPLAACGVEVHGIDASEAMIGHLASKPAGAGIHAVAGDFADLDMDTRFELIYAVFSSFFGGTAAARPLVGLVGLTLHVDQPDPCFRLRARGHLGRHVTARRKPCP